MWHTTIGIGRLGRDPEMRYTPGGTAVTTLNVATDHEYKDANGQKVKETTWFRISVFGKQAESAAQYLTKGRLIMFEGRLRPDPQTGGPRLYDRNDGSKGASFEVIAASIKFLPSNGQGSGPGLTTEEPGVPVEAGSDQPEEMPF